MSKRVQAEANGEVSVIKKGNADAKEVEALSFEKRLAEVRIEAIKAHPGAETFTVTDTAAKDKEGKPLVSKWTLPAEVAREVYELQSVSDAVYGRWRIAMPKLVSTDDGKLTGIFPAPDCFEKITSDAHKGLRRALELTNSRFRHAVKIIQDLAPTARNHTDAQNAQFLAAKQQKAHAERMISQVMKTLETHYRNSLDDSKVSDTSGSKREQKGVAAIMDETINRLGRRAQAKNASQKDKRVAEIARMMLLWVRIEPETAAQYFKRWEEERTARSQQAQSAAIQSAKDAMAAVVK